jgi:hypothetical protein
MPLLFVLLVVIATVVVFLVFRDSDAPDAQSPTFRGTAAAPDIGPDGVPEFRVESEEEYQLALQALGTSSDEIEAWARNRGFPPAVYTNSPGTPLKRDYPRERDDTLLQLAEAGDHWAMQFLAARIAPDRPLEAIEWYHKAVVHGSAYAAFELGKLYHEVARRIAIDQDDRDEVIEIARREDPLAYASLAWLLVAEFEAGLPPGAMSATLTSFRAPDEGITRSCERAATFLADIRAKREALRIRVPTHKPPLAMELPDEETAGYCSPDVFPRAEFSGCETIRLAGDVGAVTGHRCR